MCYWVVYMDGSVYGYFRASSGPEAVESAKTYARADDQDPDLSVWTFRVL